MAHWLIYAVTCGSRRDSPLLSYYYYYLLLLLLLLLISIKSLLFEVIKGH